MMIEIIEYRKKLRRLRKFHLALCLLGVLLSGYSVYVEVNLERDPAYTALCDIKPGVSCTKVFGSPWGKGFGVMNKIFGDNSTLNQPNGVYGMISYPIFILTSRFEYLFLAKATLFIGVSGIGLSAYLAYIMHVLLEDMCVVCYTIYLINVLLFIISVVYYRNMKSLLALQSIKSTPPRPELVKKRV